MASMRPPEPTFSDWVIHTATKLSSTNDMSSNAIPQDAGSSEVKLGGDQSGTSPGNIEKASHDIAPTTNQPGNDPTWLPLFPDAGEIEKGSPVPSAQHMDLTASQEALYVSKLVAATGSNLAVHQEPVDTSQFVSPNLDHLEEDRLATPPLPSSPTLFDNADKSISDEDRRQRLFDAGKVDLFYTLSRRDETNSPKTSVLNIAILQHMALHNVKYEIPRYVKAMYKNSKFMGDLVGQQTLAKLLSDYCEAVRNLDQMAQGAARGYERDPFLMKSSRALERQTMEHVGLIPDHVLPKERLPLPHDYKHPRLRQVGRNEANRAASQKQRILRFSMAAVGGLLLLVPVTIMATVPGLISSLVTTCVATLVFAFLIAWRTELGPNEVLGTTAAYAAVLVNFVGNSLATAR